MKIGCVVNISEVNAASVLREKMYKEGKESRLFGQVVSQN